MRRAFRECPTPARAEARAAVAISLNGPTSRNPPIASITSATRSRRRRDGGARGETSFGTQRLEMTRTAARARERSCCASRRERKTPCARRWGYHRRARRRAGERRMGETRGRGRAGETQRQRKDDETVATRRIRTRGNRRMQTLIPRRSRSRSRSLVVDDDDGGRKRRDANDANETAKTKTREDGVDDAADRDRATPIATETAIVANETETDRFVDRRDALAIESNQIQIFRRRPVPSRPVPRLKEN